MSMKNKVPAKNFVQTLTANVNNDKLDAEAFREFVRNTLPIVEGGEALSEPDTREVKHVGDVSDTHQQRKHRDKKREPTPFEKNFTPAGSYEPK